MPRLSFALISVLAYVAAQESRITDPAAVAIAQRAQLYELMKAEYTDERCEAAGWCPLALPWRDRRHLAHVLSPSLSFVLDVLSTSLVSVRTDPRGPRQ